jgi:hypothetical protein
METPKWNYQITLIQRGVSHDFRYGGGPLEDPAPAQPLFFALGLLSSSWARIEQQIETILIQINKSHHSSEIKALYDPNHPVSFSKKVQLLKRYFNQHPTLTPLKETMRDLTTRLLYLSDLRNGYLHAIVEDYDESAQAVTLNSIKFIGRDTFQAEQRTVHLRAIVDAARFNNLANKALAEVSRELFTMQALTQLGKGEPLTPRPKRSS